MLPLAPQRGGLGASPVWRSSEARIGLLERTPARPSAQGRAFCFPERRYPMQKETEMVKNLYAGMVDHEWNRLFQDDFHQLEWNTTWRFLKEYLPKAGLVLDAGGGPGRYTIELARQGH